MTYIVRRVYSTVEKAILGAVEEIYEATGCGVTILQVAQEVHCSRGTAGKYLSLNQERLDSGRGLGGQMYFYPKGVS